MTFLTTLAAGHNARSHTAWLHVSGRSAHVQSKKPCHALCLLQAWGGHPL